MIRNATTDDLEGIIELGQQFFDESPHYRELGYAPEKIRSLVSALLHNPDGFVRVAERAGELVGIMLGMAGEHWASTAIVATELGLFVRPRRRGSLLAIQFVTEFRDWGRERGCIKCLAGSSTGLDFETCARVYEHVGFKRNSIGLAYSYV
jgi:GNAT superfamily N-acetyltransferase